MSEVAVANESARGHDLDWRQAWETALMAAELDVASAERLLAAYHDAADETVLEQATDWVAPSLLGPVPGQFEERARKLLQRQLDVAVQVTEAMTNARGQIKAMTKLEEAESRPVYVDRAL